MPTFSRWRRGTRLAAATLLMVGGLATVAVALHARTPADEGTFVPATVSVHRPTTNVAERVGPLPRSLPVRIEVPAIGVNAPVTQVGRNADGTIQVPPLADHNLVGWYKYGPAPGQQGNAVILGHVDSYTGISVFFSLKYLRDGDRIYVTLANGRRATFVVDGVEEAPKNHFPTAGVYGPSTHPGLRLVTCGGGFDSATRHYLDNIIVYAHLQPYGA
jgi:hypothetical protein